MDLQFTAMVNLVLTKTNLYFLKNLESILTLIRLALKYVFLFSKIPFNFYLPLINFQFKITGFMNNDTISEMFTNKLIEQLYLIEEQFGDSISWEVGKIVIKLFHDNVVNKTLSDIINGNFP